MQFVRSALLSSIALVTASGVLLSCRQSHAETATPQVPAFEKPGQGPYRLSQVGEVTTYRPDGPIRGFAIFLSGDGGWNLGVVDMAKALQAKGIAVAGISTPAFLKRLESGKDKCIDPNFALVALAQDVEHRLALPHYTKPILVGYSSGATVAYAALARAPAGIYRAAVSLGFAPDLPGSKPWCAIGGMEPTRITKPEHGWLFPPVSPLRAPWIVLQGLIDQVVAPAEAKSFTAKIPQAHLIELPKVGHGFSVEANWMPQFLKTFEPILERDDKSAAISNLPGSSTGQVQIAGLPLTPVTNPRAPTSHTMAVIYSGDGGWAGLDRDMAASFAAHGIPVVGVDSLEYFWNAKSPELSARDLEAIIAHYGQLWHRNNTILVGYSYGADVLPFIAAKLPMNLRHQIDRVALLGLDAKADFQFHLSSWLDISGQNALPTVPQIHHLQGFSVQCIRGTEEKTSACLQVSAQDAKQVILPGGHHFDGNAELLVRAMTQGLSL